MRALLVCFVLGLTVPASAELVLPESPFHVGTVPNDTATTRSVTVRNTGSAPVTVKDIKTECACTRGKISPETIPSGGSAELAITINPAKTMTFSTDKQLTIFTDSPTQPAIPLRVTSTIEPEFQLDPPVLDLGRVPLEKGVTAMVRFSSETVELRKVERGPGAQSLDVRHRKAGPGAWELEFRYRPETGVGPKNFQIYLHTNNKRVSTYEYPVRADVVSFYGITAPLRNLGNVIPGTWHEVASVTSERPLEIIAVNTPAPEYQPRAVLSEDRLSVRIEVQIPDGPARISQELQVHLRAGKEDIRHTFRFLGTVAK